MSRFSQLAAEVKAKRVLRAGGKRYWSAKWTINFFRRALKAPRTIPYQTLVRWAESCAWLGGARLHLQNLPGVYGRRTRYFLAQDVKKIVKAMNSSSETAKVPEYPGLVSTDALAQELERCRDDVLWMHRQWRKKIKSPKKKPELKPGYDALGRPVRRSYVTATFAEWARDRQKGVDLDSKEKTALYASESLGVPRATILQLINSGKLAGKEARVPSEDGITRRQRIVSIKEAKASLAPKKKPAPEPLAIVTDGKADVLLPRALALSLYPHIPAYVYHTYPNRPCPLIGGEILKAPFTTWANGYWTTKAVKKPRGFLKSQLDKFPKLRAGGNKGAEPESPVLPAPPRHAGGRRADPETQEVHKFCYEGRHQKATLTMVQANRKFGREVISDARIVRIYAKRYAKKHGLRY